MKKNSLIEKDNIKKQEDYVLKLKKEKILLAKLAKQNEETIKNDYAQKNQSLDQKNSNYDNESLFQKKKKAELIEGYQKNLKKLKISCLS